MRGDPSPAFGGLAKAPGAARPDPKELRRLPVGLKNFRLEGEWDEVEWPIYLTEAQARGAAGFQLASQSSISVLPDTSSLTLSVNERLVGRKKIRTSGVLAKQVFDIPDGVLRPGVNVVRLSAEQRHRVDCSLPATYELQTAINQEQTGFLLGGERAQAGFQHSWDMAAIAPRADGASAIRILTAGKLAPDMVARAIKASQIAALNSRSLQPLVEFGVPGTDGSGLDLAVGPSEDLRALADLADFGPVAGPRSGFLPQRANRAPTFVITGVTAADVDLMIERLGIEAQARALREADDGQHATVMRTVHEASGEREAIAFSDAGFAGAAFSGRLFHLGLNVSMPMDFMGADYDRITLNLAGSYSDALDRDARILVSINGRNAAMQILSRSGAHDLSLNRMFLPLSLMRPGLNQIEIAAELPAPADAACLSGPGQDSNRLHLLERSAILMPRIARVARAPELAMMAAGGFPFMREGAKPILFVPNPDRATMSAAATLVARLAVAARRPLDFNFTITAPALDAGEVLMISPAPELNPTLMQAAGLDPERVRRAWRNQRKKNALGAAQRSAGLGLIHHCDLPVDETVSEARSAPVNAPFTLASLSGRLRSASLLFRRANATDAGVSEDDAPSQGSILAISQGFPGEAAGNLWTIVTAPDSGLLKAGVDCLSHPQIWNRLSGRLSALNADETVVSVRDDVGQRYIATSELSPGNARLILAAWLSLNPVSYVAACVALALSLAATTLWLVRNLGRRPS